MAPLLMYFRSQDYHFVKILELDGKQHNFLNTGPEENCVVYVYLCIFIIIFMYFYYYYIYI